MRTLHYQLCAVVDLSFLKVKKLQLLTASRCFQRYNTPDRMICIRGGGTLGISEWGCVAGTLEPLTYTRASSAEFCYPILEETPQIPPTLE